MVAINPRRDIYKPTSKAKLAYKHITQSKTAITLLSGAVRSSKSFTIDQSCISLLQALPPCDVLISGQSAGSVSRNVIAEWKKKLGAWRFKNNKDGKDEFTTINYRGLSDKKFYIRGGGKKGDEEQIQGATIGLWLGDEITNHTKEFVDMALSRLSLDFSQAVWSANPDYPEHFINTDFILKNHYDENYFKVFNFNLDDNASLTAKVKKRLKNSFFGVFYQRKILGKWVRAEGLVYPMFDPERHVISRHELPTKFQELRIGIDYGVQNPMTYNLWGRVGKRWYKINEYWHSGREANKQGINGQKTNLQYLEDLKEFFIENKIPKDTIVIIDKSATSFKVEMRNAGFKVKNSNSSVLRGIEFISNLLGADLIRYCEDCVYTIKEATSYSWDDKKGEKGKDEPKQLDDHCMDGDRYALFTKLGGLK